MVSSHLIRPSRPHATAPPGICYNKRAGLIYVTKRDQHLISVIEKYRGVDILRDSSPPMLSDNAEIAPQIVRLHALPNGIKVSAESVEAVRAEIDKVLDAPPDPAG